MGGQEEMRTGWVDGREESLRKDGPTGARYTNIQRIQRKNWLHGNRERHQGEDKNVFVHRSCRRWRFESVESVGATGSHRGLHQRWDGLPVGAEKSSRGVGMSTYQHLS